MKYIGNYNNWVDPIWKNLLLTTPGKARPRDWPPSSIVESDEYSRYQSAGYSLNAVNWWIYELDDLGIDIKPPWTTGRIQWWFTKLIPGQFMPMHTDPHTHDSHCKRFWVPLQDYIPGHIFIYKDSMITNYKSGDVYQYDNSIDIHGAANIGYVPRLVLQVTEYENNY